MKKKERNWDGLIERKKNSEKSKKKWFEMNAVPIRLRSIDSGKKKCTSRGISCTTFNSYLNRCTELFLFWSLFSFVLVCFCFRKSTKRVASPVSSSGAESQSDMKDIAAFKIRIKSLERELQQKKQEVEKMEHKLTEQSTVQIVQWHY